MSLFSFFKQTSLSLVAASSLLMTQPSIAGDDPKHSGSVLPTSSKMMVYKSATCGCCKEWVSHLEKQGFEVNSENKQDMSAIKDQFGIHRQYRSCHTGVSKDGYVFEGHVPAKFVTRFLKEKPRHAIGLSVPGMPVGSPGMEVGNKFMPYQVLILNKDGSSEVYGEVKNIQDQY